MNTQQVLILLPCFNEENSIETALDNLKEATDFENFKILGVNDGSEDETLNILINHKDIDYVLTSNSNKGLSEVFQSAQKFFLEKHFSHLIIYDCDSQYPADEINNLINLSANSDIVVGCRNFKTNDNFSKLKNSLQIIGSKIISYISGIYIPDATSGFRIFNKHSIENIAIVDEFTYTIDSILQAGQKKLKVKTFQLKSFNKTRESRLFRNNLHYLFLTSKTIVNNFILFKDKSILRILNILLIAIGMFSLSRFFIPYFIDGSNPGNIQSLTFGSFVIVFALGINIFIGQKIQTKKINTLLAKSENSSHYLIEK